MAELANRAEHERKAAYRLGKLSGKNQRELQALLGNPPEPGNVPASFWERVKREREEELITLLMLVFIASAQQHGLDDSMFAQSGVATAIGSRWSAGHAAQVAGQYAEHARERFIAKARAWREMLTGQTPTGQVDTEKLPRNRISEDIVDVFGPAADEEHAVSGTTDAATAGGETGIGATVGITTQDLWITEKDAKVCPICQPLHMQPRLYWARFFPNGPKAHRNCRCYLKYLNEATQ